MPRDSKVPLPALERLATYLRLLDELVGSSTETISSAYIEKITGIHAAQFRKDLSYFGEFGRPGIGYSVKELHAGLARILRVDEEQRVLLIGAGNLGSALLGYGGLPRHKFNIVAVFDNDPNKIGSKLWDREVLDVETLKQVNRECPARIGIICVPAQAAQRVVQMLADAGVKVILNFAPTILKAPDGVFVRNVCFIQELFVLSFFLP